MYKSIASAITHIYPNLQPFVDFRVVEENGVQSIVDWNTTETQPTSQQLDDAWFEVEKKYKKDELSGKCNEAICGGFISSALGVAHTYPSDEEAQRNFHSEIDRINLDPSYTNILFKTIDSGYLAHTVDQFKQVFIDGHIFGRQQITKLNQLKFQVDAAQTDTDLNNIIW